MKEKSPVLSLYMQSQQSDTIAECWEVHYGHWGLKSKICAATALHVATEAEGEMDGGINWRDKWRDGRMQGMQEMAGIEESNPCVNWYNWWRQIEMGQLNQELAGKRERLAGRTRDVQNTHTRRSHKRTKKHTNKQTRNSQLEWNTNQVFSSWWSLENMLLSPSNLKITVQLSLWQREINLDCLRIHPTFLAKSFL